MSAEALKESDLDQFIQSVREAHTPDELLKTPRTEIYVLNPHPPCVAAEFARELEREINIAKANADRLNKENAKAVESFNNQINDLIKIIDQKSSKIGDLELGKDAWKKMAGELRASLSGFADAYPKWMLNGVEQDPRGIHRALAAYEKLLNEGDV